MGIAPYKTFTFDGVSSSTYGVYLTGKGVFDAPERAVEMIEVPGRNGTFALDQGRFQNITVTYKVGMFDDSETDFATKVSNFRNWLCSKIGYVRLSDEYNPDEYRMAVYSGGFELDHDLLIAGEAEITFDCKPQRWLTSGETATAVANNGTLSNPTLFDSEPLLAVKGYGTIDFNGYEIEIENTVIGDIVQVENDTKLASDAVYTLNLANANTGDDINVKLGYIQFGIQISGQYWSGSSHVSDSITDSNSDFTTSFYQVVNTGKAKHYVYRTNVNQFAFNKGTSATVTNSISGTTTIKYNGTNYAITLNITQSIAYNGTDTITMTETGTISSTLPSGTCSLSPIRSQYNTSSIIAYSTVSALGNPTYIDCDIGECYMVSGGDTVSLNGVIDLGSDLPVLSPGTNTFTYDNTITELKVTPRWWKV